MTSPRASGNPRGAGRRDLTAAWTRRREIAYRNFFNMKTHLDHHFDLKYERSRLNHYGSSPHMLRLVRSVHQICEKSTQFFTIA